MGFFPAPWSDDFCKSYAPLDLNFCTVDIGNLVITTTHIPFNELNSDFAVLKNGECSVHKGEITYVCGFFPVFRALYTWNFRNSLHWNGNLIVTT